MASRIGEQLVRDGLVTSADIDEALALAREKGMRLASALVELGRMSADDAARALAEQHGVPAALCKHLESRDLALAALLPAGLARSLAALPLAVSRGRDALVICVRDPGALATAALERALNRPIVLAVAVESLLLPLVADAYPLAGDEADDFEVDVETDSPAPAITDGFAAMQLVDLDDLGVSRDLSQITSSQRMPGASASTDGLGAAIPELSRARRISSPFAVITPSLDRQTGSIAAVAPLAPPPPLAPSFGLDPALVKINVAESRDQVIDALLGFLRHRFEVGVVFVIREGMALGQAGFGNDVSDDAIGALVVPLSQPSVLRIAHDKVASYVGSPAETSLVQDRMFRLFGAPPSRVAVVPVTINERVVNLLYAHEPRAIPIEDAAGELGTLAMSAEEAFVRIIKEAKGG